MTRIDFCLYDMFNTNIARHFAQPRKLGKLTTTHPFPTEWPHAAIVSSPGNVRVRRQQEASLYTLTTHVSRSRINIYETSYASALSGELIESPFCVS